MREVADSEHFSTNPLKLKLSPGHSGLRYAKSLINGHSFCPFVPNMSTLSRLTAEIHDLCGFPVGVA